MENIDTFCKELTLNYLFPTKEIREFLINDVNEELDKILLKDILVCEENLIDETREKNNFICINKIAKFLLENNSYKNLILKIYGSEDLIDASKLLLLEYVFCYCTCNKNLKNINIFTNKQAITYLGFNLTNII